MCSSFSYVRYWAAKSVLLFVGFVATSAFVSAGELLRTEKKKMNSVASCSACSRGGVKNDKKKGTLLLFPSFDVLAHYLLYTLVS